MYTLSYPSNTLRKDGVIIEMIPGTPEYDEYIAWFNADVTPLNRPEILQEWQPPTTVTAPQIAAAMEQLGWADVNAEQLATDVFVTALALATNG